MYKNPGISESSIRTTEKQAESRRFMNLEKNTPRLLGAAFLLQAVASIIATLLMTPLIKPDQIIDTMINISNHPLQMQLSILGEVIAVLGIVMLGALLFITLKKQNRNMAFIALGLYVITALIIAVSRIASFALLRISQESVLAAHPALLQTLGNLFYKTQEYGYFLHMLPYTLGASIFYYLFYKSGYLPKILSIWGLIAAPLAFIGTIFDHFGVPVPLLFFVPNLPFDFGVGFWLIFKGFQSPVTRSEQTGPHSD